MINGKDTPTKASLRMLKLKNNNMFPNDSSDSLAGILVLVVVMIKKQTKNLTKNKTHKYHIGNRYFVMIIKYIGIDYKNIRFR